MNRRLKKLPNKTIKCFPAIFRFFNNFSLSIFCFFVLYMLFNWRTVFSRTCHQVYNIPSTVCNWRPQNWPNDLQSKNDLWFSDYFCYWGIQPLYKSKKQLYSSCFWQTRENILEMKEEGENKISIFLVIPCKKNNFLLNFHSWIYDLTLHLSMVNHAS